MSDSTVDSHWSYDSSYDFMDIVESQDKDTLVLEEIICLVCRGLIDRQTVRKREPWEFGNFKIILRLCTKQCQQIRPAKCILTSKWLWAHCILDVLTGKYMYRVPNTKRL